LISDEFELGPRVERGRLERTMLSVESEFAREVTWLEEYSDDV